MSIASRFRHTVLLGLSFFSLLSACASSPVDSSSEEANVASTQEALSITAPSLGIARLTSSAPLVSSDTHHLSSHGGPVVHNTTTQVVLWGGGTDSNVINHVTSFYRDVLNSDYIDWLREYDPSIGRGSSLGVATIQPSTTKKDLSDTDIAFELQIQIARGHLNATDPNTMYMVYLPPGYTVSYGDSEKSCVTFCAYHSRRNLWPQPGAIRYGVFPDLGAGSGCEQRCGGNTGSVADNATVVASHELVEAITDPDGNGWYEDGSGQEIGDLCNAQASTRILGGGNSYSVQRQWSNDLQSCIDGPWHPGYVLQSNQPFVTSGYITATARIPTMLDTWTIGRDGALWNAGYWDGNGMRDAYRSPAPMPTPSPFWPGGGIAGSSMNANNVDTWVIGTDGALWNAGWWDGTFHSGYRFPVQAPTSFHPGGGIAVTVMGGTNVDTWVIGNDDVLWNAGYLANGFHAGYRVPPPQDMTFVGGGGIAACSFGPGRIDTWAVARDGALWNAGYFLDGAFHPGYRVPTSAPNSLMPGSYIACSVRNGVMDIWGIGKDGALWNLSWLSNGFHSGYRFETSAPGTFQPHSPVAAVSRNSATIDTFAIGKDGKTMNAGWFYERP